MTALEFAQKLASHLLDMRDSDGEPGFVCSTTVRATHDGEHGASIRAETICDDDHPNEHTFTVIIIKER
jgi:hypothetical protein